MRQFNMAAVGGPHGNPFLFTNPVPVRTGASMDGLFTWYSDQQYYNMAKAAVASFDQLSQRVARIADKAARDAIIKSYGMNTTTENKSLSLRNQVQAAIAQADATGDAGDGFADDGKHGRKATDWLIDYVNDISSEVQDAELTYGILQAPQAPVGVQAAAPPAAAPGINWTIPVVAVGGTIALLAVLGGFGK